MSRRSRVVVAGAAAAAAWALGFESRCGAAVITLVPAPAGSVGGTTANAIKSPGVVTGAYFNGSDAQEIAYTYSPAGGFAALPLATAGGTALEFTVGNGINAAGMVVGQATDTNSNVFPFQYTAAGGLTSLGLPSYAGSTYSGGEALAVNGAGVSVGWTNVTLPSGDFLTHGVVFRNGTATDVTPTLDDGGLSIGSQLLAVNGAGVASGFQAVPTTGGAAFTQHAIVYANGTFTDLTPTLTSGATNATTVDAEGNAINTSGQVAETTFANHPRGPAGVTVTAQASLYTPATNGYTSVALNPATNVSSPSLAATSTVAAGIDTAGDVVGYGFGGTDDDATLWVAGSTTGIDLNAYLDTVDPADGADWILEQANAINDNGQIVGFGLYSPTGDPADGTQQAFILDASGLTSVPEPTTLAVAASLGGAALLARRGPRRGRAV